MTVLVRFSAEAASELDDATAWYDKQAPGLGDSFIDAVEAAIAIIANWPQSGALAVGIPDGRDVRRAPVARFCRLSV